MKHLLFILILLGTAGCQGTSNKTARQTRKKPGTVKFVFQEEFHNFGPLQAGEVVVYSFAVKNEGTAGLKMENAKTDCGCITVDYPNETIQPGKTGYVDVEFNSAGETGNVYKEIVITTNAEKKEIKLAIAAQVKNELINIYSEN